MLKRYEGSVTLAPSIPGPGTNYAIIGPGSTGLSGRISMGYSKKESGYTLFISKDVQDISQGYPNVASVNNRLE